MRCRNLSMGGVGRARDLRSSEELRGASSYTSVKVIGYIFDPIDRYYSAMTAGCASLTVRDQEVTPGPDMSDRRAFGHRSILTRMRNGPATPAIPTARQQSKISTDRIGLWLRTSLLDRRSVFKEATLLCDPANVAQGVGVRSLSIFRLCVFRPCLSQTWDRRVEAVSKPSQSLTAATSQQPWLCRPGIRGAVCHA
ncbi:hypothetical protein EXIGLDRAFT_319507 [Exidia glandulosa HHB12029]|uniref:Uncharacterized protein n=1 Tax=Exidia glandulosa HHB12029 TaxID=1314781 RepID=A0A165Q4B0_EXIGL|nr:hypothetical protein EXIGLDRAFT_319507 [Exidia glandulosa HHB12029]